MNCINKRGCNVLLIILCAMSSNINAMKNNMLEMKPLMPTSEPLLFSNDTENDCFETIRARAQQKRVPAAGSRSYSNELVVFAASEEEGVTDVHEQETVGGYLTDKVEGLTKLGRAGYEKIKRVDAADFIDTRFVAGLATAVTLSAFVWLATSSSKRGTQASLIPDIVIEKSSSGMLSASELKKQLDAEGLRAEQLARELLEKEVKLKAADGELRRLSVQLDESNRVKVDAVPQNSDQTGQQREGAEMKMKEQENEIALLKEKIASLEKTFTSERQANEEMKSKIVTLEEDLVAASEINTLLLDAHPYPAEFIESVQVREDK